VAKDVCEALEIENVSRTLDRLPEKMKGLTTVNTLGGNQEMLTVTESGVYKLVFTSRKPEAEKFTDWIAEEVLPSIRKTGQYIAQSMSQLEIMHKMLGAMVEGEKRQRELEERTEVIERRLTLVKDTLGQHDDDWRDTNNKMLNTIVKEKGGRDYQGVRSETYTLLEERAGCDLNTRLRNQRQRMEESGAPKAKINALTKMDIIESDKKLKEIYAAIVKELTIKYVV
jgi:prophage antirepressor-like protein